MTEPHVRIRGIYATALTALLREGDGSIVQPSTTIDDRFDETFPTTPANVRIDSTDDDEGIELTGTSVAVGRVLDRLDPIDSGVWTWRADLPHSGLFVGRVVEISDHGAIVDVGADRPGFLPFSRTRGSVETDDRLVVQVAEPFPPWVTGRRPVLTQELRVTDEIATVSEGIDGVEGGDATLATALDRLSLDRPADWGIRWHNGAETLPLSTIQGALSDLLELADRLIEARESAAGTGEPAALVQPLVTRWCWFDRRGRFVLDRHRAAVVDTMDGHHRIKAGGGSGTAVVEYVEALPGDPPAFDADASITALGPSIGDRVRIWHGKPDGSTYDLGPGEVIDRASGGELVVERELSTSGTYDGIGTERTAGDLAVSTFVEGRWWYPTVYRSADGDHKGTYVNVGTPTEVFPNRIRYLDLHIDVTKHPDGSVTVVDEPELAEAVTAGLIPEAVATRARRVAASIEHAL